MLLPWIPWRVHLFLSLKHRILRSDTKADSIGMRIGTFPQALTLVSSVPVDGASPARTELLGGGCWSDLSQGVGADFNFQMQDLL